MNLPRKDISQIERQILQLLEKVGEEGIIQKELWEKIGIDSRSGSRIVSRLEKRGLIEREKTVYKGKSTYILRLSKNLRHEITIPDFLKEIPCFTCPYLNVCGEGGSVTPEKCNKLLRWLEIKSGMS